MALTGVIGLGILTNGPGGVLPYQANTFQGLSPWGQTDLCYDWEDVLNQLFQIGSKTSGRQGMFWTAGTYNQASLQAPYSITATGTCTLTSATVSAMSINTNILDLGMPAFCSIAGFTGLLYITAIPSSASVTLNSTFGGTTGSATLTFLPYIPSSANAIRATS